MVMKPGASPHWGMNAVRGAGGELLDRAGAGDVLGQIQVVRTGGLGRFGYQPRGVVGRRAQHRELALEDVCAGCRPG